MVRTNVFGSQRKSEHRSYRETLNALAHFAMPIFPILGTMDAESQTDPP